MINQIPYAGIIRIRCGSFPGIISAAIVQHPIDAAKVELFSENKKLKTKVFLNSKRDKRFFSYFEKDIKNPC